MSREANENKVASAAVAAVYTRQVDTSTIVILDFGSQYTQLIARRIREFNVFSVVLPCTASLDEVRALKPKGVILSGGPCSGIRCRRPDR